jgi:hypothetical protein
MHEYAYGPTVPTHPVFRRERMTSSSLERLIAHTNRWLESSVHVLSNLQTASLEIDVSAKQQIRPVAEATSTLHQAAKRYTPNDDKTSPLFHAGSKPRQTDLMGDRESRDPWLELFAITLLEWQKASLHKHNQN